MEILAKILMQYFIMCVKKEFDSQGVPRFACLLLDS